MRDGRDDLQRIMDEALEGMAREAGRPLDLGHVNLAEFCRGTGPARQGARTTRRNGSGAGPRGLCGRSPATTVPGGHAGFVDDQPGKGPADSQVVFDRLVSRGHAGGPATAEAHVSRHRDLVPPPRGGRSSPRAAAGSGPGVPPARRTRRAGGLPPPAVPTVPRAESPASAWYATIAACPTSTSSPMRGRRTCLSGCSAPSWSSASPSSFPPTTWPASLPVATPRAGPSGIASMGRSWSA